MPRPPRKAPEWPLPSVLPGQPVKPWAAPDTGLPIHTVALRLPDGGWLAFIAEWPEMRAMARGQAAAERRVLRQYARSKPREWLRHARVQWKAMHDPDSVTEDELDLMLIELAKREKGPGSQPGRFWRSSATGWTASRCRKGPGSARAAAETFCPFPVFRA